MVTEWSFDMALPETQSIVPPDTVDEARSIAVPASIGPGDDLDAGTLIEVSGSEPIGWFE